MKKKVVCILLATAMTVSAGCGMEKTINEVTTESQEKISEKEQISTNVDIDTPDETESDEDIDIEVEFPFTEVIEKNDYKLYAFDCIDIGYEDTIIYFSDDITYKHKDHDQFMDLYLSLELPTIKANDAKSVIYALDYPIYNEEDIKDCIIDAQPCDRESYFDALKLDYEKLESKDYCLKTDIICQKGVFWKDYDTVFGSDPNLEDKFFILSGFNAYMHTFVEYNDGSVRYKELVTNAVYVDDENNIVENEEEAVDVAIVISVDKDRDIYLPVRDEASAADKVYYGDTIVVDVREKDENVMTSTDWEQKGEKELYIALPSEELSGFWSEDCYSGAIGAISDIVGMKTGEVYNFDCEYGDGCSFTEYTIK